MSVTAIESKPTGNEILYLWSEHGRLTESMKRAEKAGDRSAYRTAMRERLLVLQSLEAAGHWRTPGVV